MLHVRHPRLHPTLAAACVALLAAGVLGCDPQASSGDVEASASPETPQAEEAGVRDAVSALITAWEAEDAEAAIALFTEDAVAFDPVPPGRFAGPEGIRGWVTESFEVLDDIQITVDRVEVDTNGAVAWVETPFVFEAMMDGEPFRDEGNLSMVWVRQADGSYRMPLFHASPLPQPMEGDAAAGEGGAG